MDVLAGLLAIAGAVLMVLAGAGVVRFTDLYSRMHAATKATAVGLGVICGAGAIAIEGGAPKTLLAAAIVLVTGPCAAHFIGRTAYSADGLDLRLDGVDELGASEGHVGPDEPPSGVPGAEAP